MSCPNYLPTFQPQNPKLSHDPTGWLDCTAFSAAMAADFDSCGKVKTTGGFVRAKSSEPVPDPQSPGLNLGQVDDVLRHQFGIDLDTRIYPWPEFERRIGGGAGAVIALSYAPLRTSAYSGDPNFGGGHAVFLPPGWGLMDPLADGRRAGIYKYKGEAYPRALVRHAAGALVMSPGHPLGDGRVWASFTRDNEPTYAVTMTARRIHFWTTPKGVAQRSPIESHVSPFGASCTPPRSYRWPRKSGIPRHVSLVQLTSGPLKDRFVALSTPGLTLEEKP